MLRFSEPDDGPVAAMFSVLALALDMGGVALREEGPSEAWLPMVELRLRSDPPSVRSTRDEWPDEGCAKPGGYMPSFLNRALMIHGSSGIV